MKASIKFHRKVKWICVISRYWDVNEKKVAIHYWNSKFLCHTRSDDLVKVFSDGLKELDLIKLIQILMDDPNLKLKFLSEIKKLRIKN